MGCVWDVSSVLCVGCVCVGVGVGMGWVRSGREVGEEWAQVGVG